MLWFLAKMVCSYRWARISASVLVATGAIAAVCLFASRWPILFKMWWLVPGTLALLAEWRSRNMDFALEHMSVLRWRRMAFYWACIAMIVISEPVEMTFIYFQF